MDKTGKNADVVQVKYNVHTILQNIPVQIVIQFSKTTALPVNIMLFNLSGNLNIGMSIRTAAAFGFSGVFVVGMQRYDRRSEVGARNYINIHRVKTIESLDWFSERNVFPIIIEQNGIPLEHVNFNQFQLNGRQIVFIFGSESDGIPKYLLNALHDYPKITISQYGVIRSFNVSTAVSIVAYEYSKQWRISTLKRI